MIVAPPREFETGPAGLTSQRALSPEVYGATYFTFVFAYPLLHDAR